MKCAVFVLLLALLSVSCAGHPCLAERSTVAALGVALGVAVELADGVVPPELERRDEVIEAARESIDLGERAVEACELADSDADWRDWLALAVDALRDVLELVEAHGVDLPDDIAVVLEEVAEAAGGG